MFDSIKFLACMIVGLAGVNPISLAASQKQTAKPSTSLTDAYGDPLPKGAIARLGTGRFFHGPSITALAVSPDGKVIASATKSYQRLPIQSIRLWDATSGSLLREFNLHKQYSCLSFSPDGKMLAAGTENVVFVLDAATGKQVAFLDGLDRYVRFVRFLDGGKKLLTADGWQSAYYPPGASCSVRLWDLATGKVLQSWTPPNQVKDGAKKGDGKEDCHLIAATPDGRLLALGYAPGKIGEQPSESTLKAKIDSVRVIEAATGKELFHRKGSFELPAQNCHSFPDLLALSPDGRLLALADLKITRLWEIESNKKPLELKTGAWCRLTFSPDSTTLVARANQSLSRWDTATGKPIGRIPPESWLESYYPYFYDDACPVFFPGGAKLVFGHCGKVRLLDVKTGKEILFEKPGHAGPVVEVQFAPDGKSLASACDVSCCYWDVSKWQQTEALTRPAHDGKIVEPWRISLTARCYIPEQSEKEDLKVYDLATGKVRHTLPTGKNKLSLFGLAPDGKTIALLRYGPAQGPPQVLFCDLASGKKLSETTTKLLTPPITFSAFGKAAAWGEHHPSKGIIKPVEVATGKTTPIPPIPVTPHTPYPSKPVFSSDGSLLASVLGFPTGEPFNYRKVVHVWDSTSGKVVQSLNLSAATPPFSNVRYLVISPDNRLIALVPYRSEFDLRGEIDLWEINSGTRRGELKGHQGDVLCLDFAPDGRLLASGGIDGSVLIWNLHQPMEEKFVLKARLTREELLTHWDTLAQPDAARAHTALCALAHAAGDSLPFLKEHLPPVPIIKPEQTRKWIAGLDSETFKVRQQAAAELEKYLEQVLPLLEEAAEKPPSLEARLRLEKLIEKAKSSIPTAYQLRQLRAVEALERIGTAQALQILQALAQGTPQARVTQEAQRVLKRK